MSTLNSIIASLPPGRYFNTEPDGRPRSLTLIGKQALAILREHHVASDRCAVILGLKGFSAAAFDEFASRPTFGAGEEANRRALRRAELVRQGMTPLAAAFKVARENLNHEQT